MTATPDGHDGESFRVTHHGYWIGYARSVPELERWIELTDLEDALTLAVGTRLASVCHYRAELGNGADEHPANLSWSVGCPGFHGYPARAGEHAVTWH
jgi:hypothetical protein